jgi:hypothetical protein
VIGITHDEPCSRLHETNNNNNNKKTTINVKEKRRRKSIWENEGEGENIVTKMAHLAHIYRFFNEF